MALPQKDLALPQKVLALPQNDLALPQNHLALPKRIDLAWLIWAHFGQASLGPGPNLGLGPKPFRGTPFKLFSRCGHKIDTAIWDQDRDQWDWD